MSVEQYLAAVRDYRNVYGAVGDLTPEEEAYVRAMHAHLCSCPPEHRAVYVAPFAAQKILRHRGVMPPEPHPRRHLARGGNGPRSGHAVYGFRGPRS